MNIDVLLAQLRALLFSSDKASVEAEAEANIAALPRSPREFVRDPVMLEFLGLPGTGKLLESTLEQAEEYQADGGSDTLIIGPITSIMEPPTGHHPVAWFLCHHKAKPPF